MEYDLEQYITDTLKDNVQLLAIEGDEMVFIIKDKEKDKESDLNALQIIDKLKETFNFPDYVSITSFRLKFIKEFNCYAKIYDYPCTKPFDLKCINYKQYVNVYKHLLKTGICN